MKQRLKRPMALLMTIVMLLGLLPTAAFAVEEPGEPATVTVNETEPVTPSESSEPEGGQEPSANSTPENEQTLGNGNANEEPGINNPNDEEPLLPVDNSGLEPGEPDGGDSVPQADSTAEITSLTLINFTPHGETGSSNVDLLKKTDTDKAVQWDLFNSYALQVSVTVPAGNEDNTFTLTLPHGMKFVNLNTSNLEQTDGIAEAQYEKDEQIANFIPVDGESGTLTVVFESNAQQVTFSVLVQPDVAFFPLENKSEGWLISDAIQATLTCRESVAIEKRIPVDVQINSDVDLTARSLELRIGDIYAPKPNVAPGEEYRLGGNVWTGWIDYNGRQNYRLRSKVVVVLSVPEDLSLKRIGGTFWQVEQEGEDSDNYDYNLWKLTATNIWNVAPSFVNQIAVVIPKDAEPGTSYAIKQSSISVTTYGQEKAWTVGAPENGQPIWTLTVRDPDKVQVSFQTGNTTNVYDFTNQSTESGEPFTDYNTSFAGVKLTNDGVGDITGGLIYKAEFGQDVQFVTAVGIPCGWDDTENTWLPTKITVHTDANRVYTISADGSNYSAIRKVASLAYAGKGFILRASDIDGLAPTESITSVEVELPGLPKGYASSNYFLTENGGANNAYTGVWGRVREARGENVTDENVFSLWRESEAEGALASKTVATNITKNGKLSVTTPYSQIKIKDKSGTAASANDIVHIRQSIEPNRAHGSFHDAETLLYDPVIYLFEPKDLSIENVTFSIETANGKKIENLSYTVDRISGSIENLSNAYSEVYQYTLSDKVMLGWWSGDWDAVTLYVDFDYRVDPAAKTNAYDLRDMIFYKSSLGFEVTGNSATDTYNLNDGKGIGTVNSNSFTVQAQSDFNVATAIQIDGENKWYSYNPEDKANTTSVFTEGATANVKITVTNNSGATANNAEVYIPIPKKNSDILDEHFISQAGFDMFLAGYANLTNATGWTVKYGQVAEVTLGENDVPTGDFTLQDGEWSDSYDDDTNMVKLTLSGSMANGTSAEIILRFKATTETSQTDSMNIFKSWYKYSTQNASIVDTEKVYNFGTLLQNGKLNGTVYADTNRNGVKDVGESGIVGVTVKVTDSDGRTYETQTGNDGTYSFNSLPGKKELTVTVINPESPDPNNSGGSYRFHALNATAEGNIGSDVIPAQDNRSASKSEFTLEAGTATVNAGLIEPYTVTFLVSGGDGTTSFVNPSSRKIYAGQKLSEVTERVTVSLAPGLNFENKWTMLPDGGESSEVQNSDLLGQTVIADTTFTAITSSVSNTVTAMWWDTETNSIKQQFSKDVDWNKPVGDTFPTDKEVNNRPGYNFTGWSVNGTSTIVQSGEIINASVTGAVNYIAQYTEKTDITVTLNANGGAFEDGQDAVTKSSQKYGTAVNYDTPTREGYTFLGWSTDQNAETGSMSLTCPAMDTIFYAVWAPGTVRLTLLENGGTWAESSSHKSGYIDGIVGEAVNLPGGSDITREGYDFQGWYVQGDTNQTILSGYKFPTKATTLIAKWEPKQESITFNYGEASQIASETVSGAHGTPVGNDQAQALTAKTYSGYTLTGWTAPDGTVVPAANTGSIVIEGGATYTAIWAQNQTSLIFDAGKGATFPNNGQKKEFFGSAGTELYRGDLIDPVMTGKTFEGWYTRETGGDKVETFTFPDSGSITYYAHWKDAEYTVTFNYNGGKVGDDTSSTVTVIHGQSVTNVPVPELSGSTLESWQNLTTGQTMSVDEIKKAAVTADVIYNAVWSGNSYTVTFSNYDGDPNSVATVTVTESAAPVAPVVKAPEGQVFLHWKDNASENIYTAEALTKLQVKEDMNFTAVFGEDSYTITFITSNGSFEDGATQTTITKQGGQVLAENDFPTVTGNTANFTGWYCNGTTKSAEQWAGTPVNGSMTFVAAFEGKVTVSFNTMGGKWTDDGQQYANGIEGNAGEPMTLPTAEHITRTGYTFTGWYTNMDCTTKAPDVFPGSRTTYYAGWSTEGLSVTVTETPTYNGTAKTPALTVMSGTTELIYGTDYVAIYENNVNAGTATVTVYGIEDYAGLTGNATFTINKANQTVTFAKPDEQTAIYGESFANTATAKLDSANAEITYSSNNISIATVDETTGEVTILKAGEVTITATAAATSNVNEDKAEYKLTISKATPTLTFANSTVSVKTTGSVSNTLFTEPKDLIVTYSSSNTDVATVDGNGNVTLVGEGEATITATFAGDEKYNGATATYILTVDNDAIAYTAEGWNGTYNAQEHSITVKVTTPNSGATVTYSETVDGNFTAQNPTFTNAGTYTVYFKIEAKGYDAVTGSAKVIIEKAQLTEATVTGGEYTGQPVEGTVSEVKAGTLTVPEDSYEVSYVNNVNAGTAVAIITAKANSNFTGMVPETFIITPKQLTSQMVSDIVDQPYTGNQITPTVTVEDDSTPLVEGRDFTVTYGDNDTVGTDAGTVTIKGSGNYAGKVEVSFNITNTGAFKVIVDNSEHTYNGSAHTPSVVVYAVDEDGVMTPLVAGTDYEVFYADNTDAGVASVTVTGKGAYTESGKSWKDTTAYFTIQPAEQSVTFAGVTDDKAEKTYGDPTFEQAATVTLNPVVGGQTPGTVTYTSSNPAVATVDSDGKVTIVGAGTTTITASAAATQNYKGAEVSYTLTVKPKDINSEDVTASKIPDQPYGGIPVTPEFSLTDSDPDISKNNLKVNVDYTFSYSNNNGEGEGKITITGTGNYTGTKEVTFKIIPWSESQVVVTPAPITIYMGGADGYEHVIVDEDTGEIKASSSLPEPGFLFDLPDMLEEALKANGDSLTDIKFYELASSKAWTVAPYAKGSSTVYRLVPGAGQEPVRVQFINAQGETVTEDQFDVGRNVNQELTMTLYKGKVGVINAIYDGVQYPIQLGESTLTVRGVTDEAQYATVTDGTTAPEAGKPAVAADSDTTYTINGSNVQVADESGVALLYDSIIDANGEDRTSLLEDKAGDALAGMGQTPGEGNRFAYSFQYLDLVDTNNGNAWVKASKDVTIYWPYPAGTNKDTAFTLLHFEGLHRSMAADDIAGQIENCTVSKVSIEDKTETHIVLKVGSAGFSPFALVWEEKIPTPPPVNPNPPADPDDTGVSSLLETKEHIQYLAGYPDNSFGPGRNMTRAEAAQMFYNLLVDKEVKITTTFEDVPENAWYATPVNTLASLGIISGVGDNRFEPDRSITRAEFTALAMKFTVGAEKEENIFSDVKPTDWFYEAVTGSIQFGWINGYGDGTFRPNNTITRAEVTAIVNKMLGREGDQAFIQQHQEELKRFTDVTSAHWAYYHIAEATNEHDYTKQGNCEKWSSSSYEK